MKAVQFENHEYISVVDGKVNIVFFTAKGNLNFNIAMEEGLKNIKRIKEWFELEEIGYLNQIHSDYIYSYDGKIHKGDALVTDRKNTGIGVFTADCVPIMVYDRVKGIISAVHSGWKGTYMEITSKVINKMLQEYGSRAADLVVYIGPHNRQCCYEVGRDVADKFAEKKIYDDIAAVADNKLSMEECIIKQCLINGVAVENIKSTNLCTFCSKEYELYSYRRSSMENGRLFSLIFIKD